MDIMWNEETFMEARRPPHTATSSEAIYLSPCQLCNQQRLFNLDASEKLAWNRRQFFHLISCTAFWIWMNLVQVRQDHSRETCEEQEVEMDIIWNEENFMEARRPPHTTTSSKAIYLSPCQLCNQQRLFNLDASEKLAWNRRQFFPFNKLHCVLNLHEFGPSMTRSFKRNMWRAGSGDGHHMEWREFHGGSAAATHSDQLWSHLSQPVSALQPTEAVQSRRFRKTCVKPPTILSMFIGCTAFWIWMNLVQVWQDHSRETCEEQEVEMDIIWNEENFMEARWPPHSEKLQCHLSQPMSGCSNSAVALLIWTAGKSDGGRVGNLDASLNFCDTSL